MNLITRENLPLRYPPAQIRIRSGAWTLIEMAGVLGIILLLVSVLAPAILKQLDQGARDKEKQAMADIAEGFRQYVMANRRIPDQNTFFADVGGTMGLPAWQVHTNDRGRPRLLLIDDGFRLGVPSGSGALPPYAQTSFGSIKPVSARFILISSVGTPLPVDLPEGALPQNLFSNIWWAINFARPVGWNNWYGEAEDLIIQRIDIGNWIVPVLLATSPGQEIGQYSVDGGTTIIQVPDFQGTSDPRNFVAYFFTGTPLDFYDEDTNAATRSLQYSCVIKEATSFIFENRVWKPKLMASGTTIDRKTSEDLQAAFVEFLKKTAPNGMRSTTQMCSALTNYMLQYCLWAEGSGSLGATTNAARTVTTNFSNINF